MNIIKDKTALVTGGASGLGYTYVEELLRQGAKCVAIFDLPTSPGNESVATLETQFGKGKVVFYTCDVSNAEQLADAYKKVIDKFSVLDIVINNAGVLRMEDWETTINVNVTALIRSSEIAISYMGKHKGGKGGTIVNISSIAGLFPFALEPVYCASKYAVLGFSRCLAEHYDVTGVRVLTLCPGVTPSRLIKSRNWTTMEFIRQEKVPKYFDKLPVQPVEHATRAMAKLIQEGENGAVWVIEGGQPPYALKFPHYTEIKVPV